MSRQPLDFDALYGKAFRITDNSGDPSREGFSIVTPENGDAWTQWQERPEFKDVVRQHFNDPGYLMDHKYDQILRSSKLASNDLKAYAQRVLNGSSELDGIYLIGSSTQGAGNDIDLLYDFGELALDPNDIVAGIEILLEDQPGIDLDSYDTFVKVNGRFFHLSSGAGRAIVENTEYGLGQAGKPMTPLAVRNEKTASDKKPTKANTREFAGLPIVVEWDEGEIRHGKSEDGKEWERIMAAPYGYIKDTVGAGDKEGVDVYLGANENAPYVFVIEQLKDDGSFDEYKTMLGFDKEEEAVDMYCKHYPKSWRDERLGHVETFPLEEFRQAVQQNRGKESKTAAADVLYHGTGDEEAARKILTEGIQPQASKSPRSQMAPAKGRVYLTPDIGYAAIYAVGGDVFGHDMANSNAGDFFKGKDPYGYIFQIPAASLNNPVPDEDSIGEAVTFLFEHNKDLVRMKQFEGGAPERYKGERESLEKSINIYGEQAINSAPNEIKSSLQYIAQRYLTPNQLTKVMDGEASWQAQAGKKLQKYISPEMAQWFFDNGAHIANMGGIMPTHAWRFKKTDSAKVQKQDVLKICEEIPVKQQSKAADDEGDAVSEMFWTDPNAFSLTAYKEIEYAEPDADLLGGILENDAELKEWALREDLPAVRTNQRVKFMKMFKGKRVAVIDDMRAHKKGKGLGTKMIQKFIAQAKSSGCDAIILQAGIYEDQQKGFDLVAWYESLGFKTLGFSATLPLMVMWLKAPKTSALTSADKEFIESLGNRVIDEKEVGDYDLALIESTMIPDFYQLGMQRRGMSMADPAQQMQKTPVEAIKPGWRNQVSGILGVIDGWLGSYPRLYVASHNPEKTAQYVNLLKRLGYKMGEQHIEFHGLELDVPYIAGKTKHAALRLLADSPQITPHRYEQFEEGTNGWALQQDRRKGEFGLDLPDIKPMLENGEAVNDPYSVGVTKKGPIQDSGKVGYTKPTPGIPLGEEDVPGFVYLIHTAKPFHHLRHYLGWTQDLDSRLEAHRTGRGANIMRVLKENGIDWEVARTWKNVTRKFERRLKNQGGLSRHCPLCAEQGLICPSRERTKALEVPEGEDFVSECKTGSSKWLYHVTFSSYLDGISSNGLVPNAEPGITGGGEKGKVFATEASGVGHWLERATQWAYHRADNPAEEGLVPCVLRFPAQDLQGATQDPFEGHQDAHKGDAVPPDNIELWDGKKWDGLWLDDTMPVADDEGYLLQDGPVQNPKLAALNPQESELLAKLQDILKFHDEIKNKPVRLGKPHASQKESMFEMQRKALAQLLERLKALNLPPAETYSLPLIATFLSRGEEAYAEYENTNNPEALDGAIYQQENALMNMHAYLNREIGNLTNEKILQERANRERRIQEMRERRKNRGVTSAQELYYWNDVYDSHGGETYGSIYASLGNSSHAENDKLNPIVGKLDYSIYEDEVNIKMLEVRPEYQRQGIATKLYARLKQEYPGAKINHGMTTEPGEAWLKSQTASWDYTWGPWVDTKFQTVVKYTPDYPEWVNAGFSQTEQQAENLAKLFMAANPKGVTQVVPFSMAEWKAKHAAKRYTARQVAEYLQGMPGWDDFDPLNLIMRIADAWELKEVSLDNLKNAAGGPKMTCDSPENAEYFSTLKSPFPPVIMDTDGSLVDGQHRSCAAAMRGDDTIMAFVPVAKKNASKIGSVEFLPRLTAIKGSSLRFAHWLLLAVDYGEMFKALLAINPALKSDVDQEIQWAKTALRKADRITWYLRWIRLKAESEFWRTGKDDPNAKAGAALLDKDIKNYNAKGKTEISAGDAERVDPKRLKSQLEHFMSFEDPAMQGIVFAYEKPDEIVNKLRLAEDDIKKRLESESRALPEPAEGSRDIPFLKFGDGWVWWFLDRAYCSEEARAMGHCGNKPRSESDDRILSLREPIKKGDKTVWSPHLTFVMDEHGFLGEMKGRGNDKPVPKYHPYIISLLKDNRVKGTKGATWFASHNFKLKDLTEEERADIYAANPAFKGPAEYFKSHDKDPVMISEIQTRLGLGPDTWKPEWDAFIVTTWDDLQDCVRSLGNREANEAMKWALTDEADRRGQMEAAMPDEEEISDTILKGCSDAAVRNMVGSVKRDSPELWAEFTPLMARESRNPNWSWADADDDTVADLFYWVFKNQGYNSPLWANIKLAYERAASNDYHGRLESDLEYEITDSMYQRHDNTHTELRFGEDDEFDWKAAPVWEVIKYDRAKELADPENDESEEERNVTQNSHLEIYISDEGYGDDQDDEHSDEPMTVLDLMYKAGAPQQRDENQMEFPFQSEAPPQGGITEEDEEAQDEAAIAPYREEELAEAGD